MDSVFVSSEPLQGESCFLPELIKNMHELKTAILSTSSFLSSLNYGAQCSDIHYGDIFIKLNKWRTFQRNEQNVACLLTNSDMIKNLVSGSTGSETLMKLLL